MNLSRNWLNEFVDLHDITDKQFNDEMTLSGSKVETIERLDESLKNVVAGKILSMEKHPDSDHMWVCQLDVGREEPVQIVTGAPNVTPASVGEICPVTICTGSSLPTSSWQIFRWSESGWSTTDRILPVTTFSISAPR